MKNLYAFLYFFKRSPMDILMEVDCDVSFIQWYVQQCNIFCLKYRAFLKSSFLFAYCTYSMKFSVTLLHCSFWIFFHNKS